MIHGDIKPENVLIFKDDQGRYVGKMTDFGYSSPYSNEEDRVMISRTRPWEAPEYDKYDPQGANPANARQTDVFSFGLLCVWILFEEYLSKTKPLPKEAEWARSALQTPSSFIDMVQGLKNRNELTRLSCDLLSTQQTLAAHEVNSLKLFFCQSLSRDLCKRPSEMPQLLRYLSPTVLVCHEPPAYHY
jgi:serine/threonine protein kinase